MPLPQVVEVVGVYDADHTLTGEVAYVVGKLLGRRHCALCDVTHSPVRRKREWDALMASSDVPLRAVHRDERDAALSAATPALPVVVGRRADGTWVTLLDADALDAAAGSVGTFAALLRAALDRAGEGHTNS
jgi:hypothetical protein